MDLEFLEELKRKINLESFSKPMLIGIIAILIMVAVAAARLLASTATAKDLTLSPNSSTSQSISANDNQKTDDSSKKTLQVHVTGAVSNPGLYEVAEGDRVGDAIEAAGSFSPEALESSINLARVLTDGEQIFVESKTSVSGEKQGGNAVASEENTISSSGASSSGNKVNINLASAAELSTLPGIGPSTASKIVADRKANGPFKSKNDLQRVSGIGEKKFEAIEDLIII